MQHRDEDVVVLQLGKPMIASGDLVQLAGLNVGRVVVKCHATIDDDGCAFLGLDALAETRAMSTRHCDPVRLTACGKRFTRAARPRAMGGRCPLIEPLLSAIAPAISNFGLEGAQCSLSSMTRTSVGSGSWGTKPVNCGSRQLARFTTVPDDAPAWLGSTTFKPSLLRKNV